MNLENLHPLGLPLRVKEDASGAVLSALEDFLMLPTVQPEDEPAWQISWQDAPCEPIFAGGQPVVVVRRSLREPRVWWRFLEPPLERFVNPDDRTEVLLEPKKRHLSVVGREPEGPRRGFTLQESLKCLLKGFLAGHGWVVAHAAAVVTPVGAVLILGPKGAGKSTLQLSLLEAGCSFLSADRTFVRPNRSGEAYALPWPGAVRLTAESVSRFKSLVEGLPRDTMTHSSRTGKLRIPFSTFFQAFRSTAPGATPIRAFLTIDRTPVRSPWRLEGGGRKRCVENIFSAINDPRPNWLSSHRWWPSAVPLDPFGQSSIFSLRGDENPAFAADLILNKIFALPYPDTGGTVEQSLAHR